MIFLLEVTRLNVSTNAVETLGFSSGRGYAGPGAPRFYAPGLSDPGEIARSLFGRGQLWGTAEIGIGAAHVDNADGAQDDLISHAWAKRPARLLAIGDERAAYGSATVIATGTLEQLVADVAGGETIAFRWRDRFAELDKPLEPATFAGTNALPAGVEGTADDIRGQPKPLLLGTARNFSPPLVNTSRLIYQLSTRAVASINGCRDRGAALTAGTARASLAALEANVPSAGAYDFVLADAAGCFIRLGSTPSGGVTVDASEGADAAARTTAQLVRRALEWAGLGTPDLGDVAALDAAVGGEAGLWLGEGETVKQAIDALLPGAAAYLTADAATGTWRLGRTALPSGAASVSLIDTRAQAALDATSVELLQLEAQVGQGPGRGLPVARTTLLWRPNATVQPDGERGRPARPGRPAQRAPRARPARRGRRVRRGSPSTGRSSRRARPRRHARPMPATRAAAPSR